MPEQEQAVERLTNFKKAVKQMIAVTEDAYKRSDRKGGPITHRPYTKEEIKRIIAFGTSSERAELSEHFFRTNGFYKRIILHYATFLTYAWLLIPKVKSRKKTKENKINSTKNSATYYEAADFCSSFQIEGKCKLFAKEVLVKGGYYGLIHDNGEYVAIQNLPFDYCRSRFKNEQDVDIVEFNVAFFDTIREEQLRKEIIKTYPKFISKAYYEYKNKGKEKWIFLPADLGIYFCFFEEIPFFLDLIPLLDDLEDYKEIDKKRNLLALKRILVQEVKTDGLKLVFEPEEAAEMHEGAVEMLNNNQDVDVLTTYNDTELLDLSGNENGTEIQAVLDLIFEAAGVSKEIFSSKTEAGLKVSLQNDLSIMSILGDVFGHFFTVLVNNKFSTKTLGFKLSILPVSEYNKEEYTSKAKDLAAFGYSFLTPVAGIGMDQLTLTDLKDLENELLDFENVLKPLQSAYTQSGKTNAISAAASKTANSSTSTSSSSSSSSDTKTETTSNKSNSAGGGEK